LNLFLIQTSANEDLKGAFDLFDGDHDGKISAEELFQGLWRWEMNDSR
jgi:Ca2+-binding EF-hand superfamily protein